MRFLLRWGGDDLSAEGPLSAEGLECPRFDEPEV